MKNGKLGIALCGLGAYSAGQLAPALLQAKHCYLAGVISGNPEKIKEWQAKYGLDDAACYSYDNFEDIRHNSSIDIVYVVVPNGLHAKYAIQAAAAGKHVICEKPMAVTVQECDEMIAACKQADRLLSVGYRLHFEPHHKEVMRLGRQNILGAIKLIEADHGLSETGGWRLDKQLAGGGPLMDVGIYCVQAARYITGEEPVAVTAQEGFKNDTKKFDEVEEAISWQMEMPGGVIAKCSSSYTEKQNALHVTTEDGWFGLQPAFPYTGIKGNTSNGEMNFPQVFQQALQMDDFALSILNKQPVTLPGEEGRRDVKILQAIYKAMLTGERILIDA